MEILIGADPEIFVRNSNNELISAYGLIPGTKKEPHKVKAGAVQVDGMALEFNIDPASSRKEFKDNINAVMGQLQHMIGDNKFDISPTAHFGAEMIAAQPQEARDLGCEPDYDAYTGLPNPKPNVDAPFRTASGHIHIGWTNGMNVNDPDHIEACRMLTKQLDVMLAPLSRMWDDDTQRRELYGKLGAFRPKPFGVEYRVLSNAWLRHKETIDLVYDVAVKATNSLLSGKRWYENVRDPERAMNAEDPTTAYLATDYCEYYLTQNPDWMAWFRGCYDVAYKAFRDAQNNGVKGKAPWAKKKPAAPDPFFIIDDVEEDGMFGDDEEDNVFAPPPAAEFAMPVAQPANRFEWGGNFWDAAPQPNGQIRVERAINVAPVQRQARPGAVNFVARGARR